MPRFIYCFLALLSFTFTLVYCPFVSADSEISWNTFLGSSIGDHGHAVAADSSGNLYVTGTSYASWGLPINAHSGEMDVFVAKLDSDGVLQWHTFLGSNGFDYGLSVAVDTSGNLYVTGYSSGSWGSPINTHSQGLDAFVVKLDSNGVLQWHTFLGSCKTDSGTSIATDGSGNLYVTGFSEASWGLPINPHAGWFDAFVAKLDNNGVLRWHTFLGSNRSDLGYSVATDSSGNLYVTGECYAGWGSPINPLAGEDGIFVAKLDGNGVQQWHTFLGTAGDGGYSIAVDNSDDLYVAGLSSFDWGLPISSHADPDPHTGLPDFLVAKLNSSGVLQWHTFLGSSSSDYGHSVAADGNGNLYVTGRSEAGWGWPITPHAGGGNDAFVAKLDSSGVLQWHTFLGSDNGDYGQSIAADSSGNLYVAGISGAGWGTPINPHAGSYDAFVTKIYDLDIDDDGWINHVDSCPYDLYKSDPGACGCGVADTDTDGDGTADCIDPDDDGDGVDDGMDAFPRDPDEWADNDLDGTGDNADRDDDNDGSEDSIEMAGPGNGDGNADGIADSLQSHINTLAVLDGQQFCTLALPAGHRFTQSQSVNTPPDNNAPDNVNFDYGYFDFTTGDIGTGQSTTITLYLPAGASPTTYYKYGKTADNPIDHWYEFLYDGQTGAEIDGNIITLHFEDGQRGDDVLTEDGLLVDLGGPGFEITANKSGSGGGGCFISGLRR